VRACVHRVECACVFLSICDVLCSKENICIHGGPHLNQLNKGDIVKLEKICDNSVTE
jgi:hypothetical protein